MGVIRNTVLERVKLFFTNPRWRFIYLLRRAEYYKNVRPLPFGKILRMFYFMLYKNSGIRLGFSIPLNVCGPGLSLPHYGTIVISKQARIGCNCRIHVCVNIGASGGRPEAPVVGDNVYIGPGAKLFGNIRVADNVYIGANAVVNKSIAEDGAIVGGVPAKVLKKSVKTWWQQNEINLL